ncbi:MHYT domain-containing protein [Nocardia rhizosphaerae]|uniref:MHYT domain-containing protein n=1 Tax=Nocardia rhizosphaerae TaxID=1691571 RepID=A0ABV8L4R8_9NOCA
MVELLAAADAETFGRGTGVAWLAYDLSVLGALVAFACVRHAKYSLRFRLIWLLMAAVSLGGVGLWLANAVALLGIRVPDAAMRYNVALGATGLVIAVVGVLAGLLISGRTPQLPRLVVGGLTMGLGIGLSTFLTLDALRVQGSVDESLGFIAISVLVSMALSTATLWAAQVVRPVWLRVVASLMFGLGVVAVYYTAVAALEFTIDPGSRIPSGIALFDLVFPMFVIGALGLTLPITAVLIAPDRRDSAEPNRPAQPVGAR